MFRPFSQPNYRIASVLTRARIGRVRQPCKNRSCDWLNETCSFCVSLTSLSVDISTAVKMKMANWCVRAIRQSSSIIASPSLVRATPRLLCTAAQQKSSGTGTEEENGAQKPEPGAPEKAFTEEKMQLEEQLKDATDKYKRALADTENLRQRSQKMIDDAKLYGIQGFCKDLLEVADILEKATESVPKTEVSAANPHLKDLYDGLVMTEVQIQKVFKKHGLVKLNPDGQKFDPYEHEAVFHAPVEGKEPGTVAVVTKVGYKLHGRTLRPALVGVVKAP